MLYCYTSQHDEDSRMKRAVVLYQAEVKVSLVHRWCSCLSKAVACRYSRLKYP